MGRHLTRRIRRRTPEIRRLALLPVVPMEPITALPSASRLTQILPRSRPSVRKAQRPIPMDRSRLPRDQRQRPVPARVAPRPVKAQQPLRMRQATVRPQQRLDRVVVLAPVPEAVKKISVPTVPIRLSVKTRHGQATAPYPRSAMVMPFPALRPRPSGSIAVSTNGRKRPIRSVMLSINKTSSVIKLRLMRRSTKMVLRISTYWPSFRKNGRTT